MKCPKCNEEVKGKEKFCVKCGFNLEETRKEEKATKKEIRNEKVLKVKK